MVLCHPGIHVLPAAMSQNAFRKAIRYFVRAVRLRCPVCGISPIFPALNRTRSLHDWFTPLDGCPRCGYAYDREPGYFLLSIWAVNYGAASLLAITLYVLFEWLYDWPVGVLIAAVIVPTMTFNLLFARHSKALFIALDHYFDPHERDGGDGRGNIPAAPSPPPVTPPRSKAPPLAGAGRR